MRAALALLLCAGCPDPVCTHPAPNSLNLTGSDGLVASRTRWQRQDGAYVLSLAFTPPAGPNSASYDYTFGAGGDAGAADDHGTYEVLGGNQLFFYSRVTAQTGVSVTARYSPGCGFSALELACNFASDGGTYCGPLTGASGVFQLTGR